MSATTPAAVDAIADDYEALIQFLYMAPVGLAQTRLDGEIVLVNPLCAQLLMPLSRDGNLQNLFAALESVAPDLAPRARDFAPQHGKICDAIHLKLDAGLPGLRDPRVLAFTLLKLGDDRLMAVLDDISLSVKRENELRRSQAWIHNIVIGLTDHALLSLDEQGRMQGWNPGVRQLTGFEAADCEGHACSLLFQPSERASQRLPERLQEARHSGWSLEEGWMLRANGQRYWGSSLIAPVTGCEADPCVGRAFSLIVRDISDRREANEALRRSVFCDYLTGLANRRAFFDSALIEIERCTRAGEQVSLLMFDADHFKSINDRHGHATGDAVLRHLAAGLSASFRSSDLLARFGGEEFVVLLPRTSVAEAEALARRFCLGLAATPVTVDGHLIRCTASVGVASSEGGTVDLDTLVRRADTAMYAAKAAGRDRVCRWQPGAAESVPSPAAAAVLRP